MGELDNEKLWGEAEKVFESMKPKIVSLAKRRIRFDSSIELEDAIQQAKIGLYEMFKQYNECYATENGSSVMNKETFAHWFIEKEFQGAIDYDRVIFYRVDNDTGVGKLLYGKEYIRDRREEYNKEVESLIVKVLPKDKEGMRKEIKAILYAKNEVKALQLFESFRNSALGNRYSFLMDVIKYKILNLRNKYSVSSCYGLSNSVESVIDNVNCKKKLNGD